VRSELFGRIRGQDPIRVAAGCDQTALDAESAGSGNRKDIMNEKNGNGTGASPRRKFDEDYKRQAVELTLQAGRSVKSVAKELGIQDWSLYEWRKLYAPRPGEPGSPPQSLDEAQKEISRLRAEVFRMREREIVLKKSLGILSETPESGLPRSR
jgi:transposase-like protein